MVASLRSINDLLESTKNVFRRREDRALGLVCDHEGLKAALLQQTLHLNGVLDATSQVFLESEL